MYVTPILCIVSTIGILIPLAGIVSILKGEQNKVSTHLLLTNLGCLVMNSGNLLLLISKTEWDAINAFKVEYFGNIWFYFFFGLFIFNYLDKNYPRWIFNAWALIEGIIIVFLLNEKLSFLVIQSIKQVTNAKWFFTYIEFVPGPLYYGRYAIILIMLLGTEIWTLVQMFKSKVDEERFNFARLAGAEAVVMFSLFAMLVFRPNYDFVPIFSSGAILAIILSVIRGEFFGMKDMGREWAFEQMEEALIVVDSAYGFLEANTYAEKLFPELEKWPERKRVSETIFKLFETSFGGCEMDGKFYGKKTVDIYHKKKVVGHSLLLIDTTEQIRLMNALEDAKRRADEANNAKSVFLSNMSHEIRTPMNAIVGMTDILLRMDVEEKEREYLENIKNSGNALVTIINDILDISKIESGKMEIVQEEYAPMSMLSDLAMIFLNRIGEKDIELYFDIDKNLPVKLYGDQLRLRQVIINIVNNAIKFTDAGAVTLSLKVETAEDDNINLFVSVKDTGQGIKPEDIDGLFDSFKQADIAKNRYKEGTGLGLSISKELVELLGGTIQVKSVYGEGSEFYFSIPQKVVDTRQAAQIKRDPPIYVGGCMKDENNLKVLKKLCLDYGVHFVEKEAIEDEKENVEFFFVDDLNVVGEKIVKLQQEKKITLCLLHNPMKEKTWSYEVTTLNKPLYTLNFCQMINRERIRTASENEDGMNFVAPDAKILIVDDNAMNRKVALGLLEPLKMTMDVAENGKQAVDKIKKEKYDLIFMDHMMPVMDGVEATRIIRDMEDSYYKNLPIVALTANAVLEARSEFIEAGMNDFVAKPIKFKEISAVIKRLLPTHLVVETDRQDKTCSPLGEIPDIEGLDVSEGIANCGTAELFYSLLGDFYKLIDLKTTKLNKCLEDGLIRDYTIEVHALKNTSRMIGAMELSKRFYRMEQYGNAEDIESIRREISEVMELYQSYKAILEPYAGLNENDKKQVSNEALISKLQELEESVDTFDLDKTDEIMTQLDELVFPKECQALLSELRAYVADVAMEDIVTTSKRIIQVVENIQEAE